VDFHIAADAVDGTVAGTAAGTAADKVADTAESLQLDFDRPVKALRWELAEPTAPQMLQVRQRQAQQRLEQMSAWELAQVVLLLPRVQLA
jgi:hypothetical protein